MKISKKYIRDLIRVALREAEEEKAADEGGEEGGDEGGGGNPFAGSEDSGGEEGGGEEEAGGEEAGGEEEKEGGEAPKPEDLTINFNISKVKRYNSGKFAGNTGVVKKVTKDGLVVTTQPDNVDIVVNFEDITESAKKFFKNRR